MISSRKNDLKHLLQEPPQRGYPTDYLIARLKGRRTYFIGDYRPILLSDRPYEELSGTGYNDFIIRHSKEGPWRRLLSEYMWVYHQMNGRLRAAFRPYFLYHELRTISTCLRYKKRTGREEDISGILCGSLLSDEVRDVLTLSPDLPTAIKGVKNIFQRLSDGFRIIEDSFVKYGLAGAEAVLSDTFLEYMAGVKTDEVIRRFFRCIIDSRNILTLYKNKRWQIEGRLSLIRGGGLSDVLNIKKETDIITLVKKLIGILITEASSTRIETALTNGLLRLTRKMERDFPDTGLILRYLNSCYIEAVNLSLILYGGRLERERLEDEITVLYH